jgi:hypothetical protein
VVINQPNGYRQADDTNDEEPRQYALHDILALLPHAWLGT